MSSPQYTLDAPPADNAAAVEPNRQGLYLVMVDELNPNAGLFLGTQQAAQGATLLRQYGISKIVCVGTPAFHRRQEDDGFANSFVYLEIPVLDLPSENLLVHLDACASFIGDGMARGQSVLVNCVFAQSRSVAVVVAYIMKRKGIALADAVEIARAAQPTVHINPGFKAQLELYQDMGCSLSVLDEKRAPPTAGATYRWFLFASNVSGGHCSGTVVPYAFGDEYTSTISMKSVAPVNSTTQTGEAFAKTERLKTASYRCKACRTLLFSGRNVMDHLHPIVLAASDSTYESFRRHGDGSSWLAAREAASAASDHGAGKPTSRASKECLSRNGRGTTENMKGSASGNPSTSGIRSCTSVFTEALPWVGMLGVGGGLARGESSGKINCTGRNGVACGNKLGTWSLQGTACSCGRKVKPAMQFTLSRIEVA